MSEHDSKKIGRREMLKRAALVAAGLAAIPVVARAAAEGTVPKAAMKYQDTPKGKEECSNCLHFIPGSTPTAMGKCTVVAGAISPHGWCVAYAKKKS